MPVELKKGHERGMRASEQGITFVEKLGRMVKNIVLSLPVHLQAR